MGPRDPIAFVPHRGYGNALTPPEADARKLIDAQLQAAGWIVQDRKDLNPYAGPGVAVREFPLLSGEVDYLLYAAGVPIGVVEAKKVGATLTGVEVQTTKYTDGVPEDLDTHVGMLPFVYQSTGIETRFTNLLDPEAASRPVRTFHRPETLLCWVQADPVTPGDFPASLRARIAAFSPVDPKGMRAVQVEAVTKLEARMAEGRRRALIQMATGAGKTYTAITSAYRLLKQGKSERILFLVDRINLGEQAEKEFLAYRTPDDGRLFTELYNVQLLKSNKIDPVAKVVITTIQRLYSMLRGEPDLDPSLEEGSRFEDAAAEKPVDVEYNAAIPIEFFDVVFVDESHRSIYTVWRPVLEYFDAYLIGLTATPNKHTYAFFNGNVVMEYTHEKAVADGVNVPFGVYEIRTHLTERGVEVKAGEYLYKRDRQTRAKRWDQADEDKTFASTQLNRDVVAPAQIRAVVQAFKERVLTEIFPGRTDVPKTLIFAVNDSHADDIVQIVREEFGKGNDFCQKITYRTTGEAPKTLLQRFRTAFNPRIVVTVDMIATGTDVKPLEIVMFMRSVKSRGYFEQMKGRGVRTMLPDDFRQVTPDADAKTHFMIVDCVGLSETDLADSAPLEREPSTPLKTLLERVAMGRGIDEDTLSTIIARLSRLDKKLNDAQRAELVQASGGKTIPQILSPIARAIDPEAAVAAARAKLGLAEDTEPPAPDVEAAAKQLMREAVKPFADPKLRDALVKLKSQSDQLIVEHPDTVTHAGVRDTDWARNTVQTFEQFLRDHKDDYAALQIFYSRPRGARRLRFRDVKELAKALSDSRPPLSPETLWRAYETLEKDRVRGASARRLVTDVVSLVQYALKEEPTLAPFPERVATRYDRWKAEQETRGRKFTPEQEAWLSAIRDYVATSAEITTDDFDSPPFSERGGLARAARVFGGAGELGRVIDEMNEVLGG